MRQRVGLDAAVMAALGDGERRARLREMTVPERKRATREAARSKATYDLPEELVRSVAEIAEREDCSASSLAGVLLRLGVEAYERGEVALAKRESRSPRFRWIVE